MKSSQSAGNLIAPWLDKPTKFPPVDNELDLNPAKGLLVGFGVSAVLWTSIIITAVFVARWMAS